MRRVLAVLTSLTIGFSSSFSIAVLNAQNAASIARERPAASPFAPDAIRRAVNAAIASDIASQAPDSQAQDADGKKWAKVIGIRPGAGATVTVAGGTPINRIVLGADESSLTLMVTDDKALPIDARDALRSMVLLNPKQLISLKDTGSYTDRDRHVRFSPEGIFVADRKVGSLNDMIQVVDRRNVLEVRRGGPGGRAFRILSGFLLGYVGFGFAAQAMSNDDPDQPGVSTAAVVSGLAGGVGLAILFDKLGTSLVYRR